MAVLTSSGVDDDGALVDRVRAGDEAAFAELVRRYQPRLLRLAQATVGSRAVAEEVCQDTWLAVVRGVDRFEGRSSFKTWLFHVLLNRARTRRAPRAASGPHRTTTSSNASTPTAHGRQPPVPWSDRVDERLVAERLAHRVHDLLPGLPEQQRQVVVLRDVEGLPATEVASLLGITDGNQRVLLHRGRARLRESLAVEMGSHQ